MSSLTIKDPENGSTDMSKEKKLCFYCGAVVMETTGVGDHFPFQRRDGGRHTVDCCKSCHDMKDLLPIHQWPKEWQNKILNELLLTGYRFSPIIREWWQELGREAKLGFAQHLSMLPLVLANEELLREAIEMINRYLLGEVSSENLPDSISWWQEQWEKAP